MDRLRTLPYAALASAVTVAAIVVLAHTSRVAVARPEVTTFVVNSTLDELDFDPFDGLCATNVGVCTLRAAIMQANVSTGVQTITLPAGVFTITRVGNDDEAKGGDLDISESVVIEGAGAGVTIIDGNGSATNDRVFHVLTSAQDVLFRNLTIRNGSHPVNGGGIRIEKTVEDFFEALRHSIQLSAVSLEGNRAPYGGGLSTDFRQIFLANSIVRSNVATNTVTNLGDGGGLDVFAAWLTLTKSTISNNQAVRHGGGLLATQARIHVEQSEFAQNEAGGGGAISNDPSEFGFIFGRTTIVDSLFQANKAAVGGAIENGSTMVMTRTVLRSNSATNSGGAMWNEAVFALNRSTTIESSTLSQNTAPFGGAIAYGSLPFVEFPITLTLRNSTVSGNRASHDGGAIWAAKGAIFLFNTTVAGNQIVRPIGQFHPIRGGGVFITSTADLTLANSILAENSHGDGFTTAVADDCYGPATSLGYNVILTTTNCQLSGATGNDAVGLLPLLGPLQDNGGGTPTRALLPGSPAINFGDPTGCRDETGPIPFDQRGMPRTAGGRCDIGAFEVGPNLVLTDVLPSTVPVRPAFSLTVNGGRFLSGTQALWNGAPVSTTVISSTRLLLDVPVVTSTGSYTVAARYGIAQDSLSNALVVSVIRATQVITLSPVLTKSISDPSFAVTATASSGLTVSLSVAGDCAISGILVSLIRAGSCTVTANQAGDALYQPATEQRSTFTILPSPQSRQFLPIAARAAASGW